MKAEDILKTGSVEVHAKVGGIRQLHVLNVTYEKTVWGTVPYLVSKHKLPTAELLRLAQELGLPIKCHGVTAFPKGKAPQDFARKEEPEAGEEKDSAAEKADDPKPEKKVRKKILSHDAILKSEEPAQENTDGAGATTQKDPEPAEEASEEPEAAPTEAEEEKKESAPAMPPTPGEPQTIEIEGVPQPDAKKEGQEQKEEAPKEKKRTFSDDLLSEGILR
jgi:hypothetical protein